MALNDVKKISGRLIYLEGEVPAQAAYIESVKAETLSPGSEAYARNDGSSQNVDLVFGIPLGNGVVSIELISASGLTKNYRITMLDGTHFDYSISDGSSIASISKTSSAGLVDTYTVLLTNGDTSTFEVTNGNGIASITKTSTDNLTDTYTISYTNGTTSTFSVVNGNSIASVSKVSTQVLTDTYEITYTDEDKNPDSFTVVNGRGITSIAKTSTSGLVDTYTITYNDNSTSTFTVTNGEKGDKGDTGETGNGIASIALLSESGLVKTYRITMTDGTHFDFDVTDGEKGDTGETGATGNGIASIEKTATVGLVDTYTITFTDGTTTTFTVTNGSDMWGNITGTLSDQTDLQTALDSKAPAITETASGSIASFTDGSASPVTALSVAIDPVQDLHGYDAPWPAGGGINKYPPIIISKTSENPTVSTTDDVYTINGSPTGYGQTIARDSFTLPAGSYYFKVFVVSGSGNVVPQLRSTDGNTTYASGLLPSFTLTEETILVPRFTWNSGTISNLKIKLMIVSGSEEPTSYAPYSNICPISGHTSATVTRTGKNLLDQSKCIAKRYINANGGVYNSDNWSVSDYTPIKGGQTYTFSGYTAAGWSAYHAFYNSNKTFISSVYAINHSTFTAPNNATYVRLSIYTETPTVAQLELSSTATAYEPYQGQTVTIDLDGTRYGGTLDVLTGEMTVTWVKVVFDGSDSGKVTYKYPNKYCFNITTDLPQGALVKTPNNNSTIGLISDMLTNLTDNALYNGNYTGIATSTSGNFSKMGLAFLEPESVAAANAWLAEHPITVIAPLAEPQTVFLTPSQISTLLGQNNIWADTGDVAVEYRADTRLFIQEQIAQSETLTRKMIADIANGDLAPKTLAVDELVIVGDELRKATESIGQGSAITSLNSTTANLADVIKALQ